jgi:hypothetical protein
LTLIYYYDIIIIEIKKRKVAIMARFNYFFNFSNEDVEIIHKSIMKYGIMDWVQVNSETSMQMTIADNGFCIETRRLDDLKYRIEENNTILRFKFGAAETIAEWRIPTLFSSVTVERYE